MALAGWRANNSFSWPNYEDIRLRNKSLAGLTVALALTRFLQSLLFGISRTDAATFAGVTLLLALAAAAAGFFPVRRETKIDPISAIRHHQPPAAPV